MQRKSCRSSRRLFANCAKENSIPIIIIQSEIPYLPTNSFYQMLSADVANKHSFDIHGIFIRTGPAGNIKADKEKYTEKIDGAVATVIALDRAIQCGNDAGKSVYDSRGLIFI